MNKSAIALYEVVKQLGEFRLGPIDFSVPQGSVVGFIGQNGAGKSTTMKLILGLLRADSGTITVSDAPIGTTQYKDSIGVVFDDLFLPEEMDAKAVEAFAARVYSHWSKERFFSYIRRFDIPETRILKQYSRGMKMKLSIAMALSHEPKLLLLDEATSGLDPIVREEILDILRDYMADGERTILISSHILSDLEKIADYIAFIHKGQLLFMEPKYRLEEEYGILRISKEEAEELDPAAVIGRLDNAFGEEILVRRDRTPAGMAVERPSIEEIMIFFVKGAEVCGR